MTLKSTHQLAEAWLARTPNLQESAIIEETLPILEEWSRGEITDDQLYSLTTPTERATCARHLLFTQQYKTLITNMLDAIVKVDARRNHLVETPHGIITNEEMAEYGGHIRLGNLVFPEHQPTPKTKRVRDVPF